MTDLYVGMESSPDDGLVLFHLGHHEHLFAVARSMPMIAFVTGTA